MSELPKTSNYKNTETFLFNKLWIWERWLCSGKSMGKKFE